MARTRKTGSDPSKTAPALRWPQEKRLAFIEFRLLWEGRINRSDLCTFFGISIPQAALDLAQYRKLAPDNLDYDSHARQHVPGRHFRPVLIDGSAQDYLNRLRLVAEGLLPADQSGISHLPSFEILRPPARHIESRVLRAVLDAIHSGSAMEVLYQNTSNPEPRWRFVVPHALASDGKRWHVRVRGRDNGHYWDMLLARILDVGKTEPDDPRPQDDRQWQEMIVVRLGPNPDFSVLQKKVIELDLGMENGELRVDVRKSMLFYFIQMMNIDMYEGEGGGPRRPRDQPLFLLNREEVKEVLGSDLAASYRHLPKN